ncbi:HAD hydrolase-like protein [Candidatus Bathyarchaeota archaeon]|nr:HAD hydrolase-like protein [Candidatus Bathyarchaeota archaeon]
MLKGIIFDLDSTLIQAQIDFVKMKKHMIRLLEEHGHPEGELSPTEQTTVQIMECAREAWDKDAKSRDECQTITDTIEGIMNKGELDAVVDLHEIEGACEAITELKEKGLKLAILTRSHHEYALKALDKINALNFFDVVLGRNETPEPKPYRGAIDHTLKLIGLERGEVAMIGDHQIDRDSASNSGTMFIGVATGRRGMKSWADQTPPEHFLPSVKELPGYLVERGFIK